MPPGYHGPLPEGGFAVARSRTNLCCVVCPVVPGEPQRSQARGQYLFGSSPRSTRTRPGASEHASAISLPARRRSAGSRRRRPAFHEGSGKVLNTIPPNDCSFFEMLNEVVQQEPATSLDPELMGPIAAIGIVKDKPFRPTRG